MILKKKVLKPFCVIIIFFSRAIPSHGNTAEIALTALHRNFMGVDEFLGLVAIPLREFDVYDRPRTR